MAPGGRKAVAEPFKADPAPAGRRRSRIQAAPGPAYPAGPRRFEVAT